MHRWELDQLGRKLSTCANPTIFIYLHKLNTLSTGNRYHSITSLMNYKSKVVFSLNTPTYLAKLSCRSNVHPEMSVLVFYIFLPEPNSSAVTGLLITYFQNVIKVRKTLNRVFFILSDHQDWKRKINIWQVSITYRNVFLPPFTTKNFSCTPS